MAGFSFAPQFLYLAAVAAFRFYLPFFQTRNQVTSDYDLDYLAPICYHDTSERSNINPGLHGQGYFKRRIRLYRNHSACLSLEKIYPVEIHPNPGPQSCAAKSHLISCLYLNARGLTITFKVFQTLATEADF